MIFETAYECDSCAYAFICVSIFYYNLLAESNESALVKIRICDVYGKSGYIILLKIFLKDHRQ